MRIKEVPVYTYGELSESAKDRVKQWLNDDCFMLTDTLENDLSEYYEIPHAELSYSLSCCQGDGVSFTGQWEGDEMLSILNKVYEGNVPHRLAKIAKYFTLEFTRIDRMYAHTFTVTTYLQCDRYYGKSLAKYIEECEKIINEWRIDICRELEKTGYSQIDYNNSDEAMSETCECNGYEFYEDGELA